MLHTHISASRDLQLSNFACTDVMPCLNSVLHEVRVRYVAAAERAEQQLAEN